MTNRNASNDKITLNVFETREHTSHSKQRRYTSRTAAPVRKKTKSDERYRSLRLKLYVCAAVCLIVALVKVVNLPVVSAGLQSLGTALENETENEDTLGKLKFVELPGLLEVFAGGDKFTLPIEYTNAVLDETKTILVLNGSPNATVTTCGEGKVKSIGKDSELGDYIVIRHGDDTEICYFGFETVTVDENQPINKLDTIGILCDSGKLILKVKVSGEPQNPCDFFPVTPSDYRANPT